MKPADTKELLALAKATCVQHAGRLTEKRKRVLAILLECDLPKSAYQICDLYTLAYEKSISIMSVYRMLKFLQDMHLVHRLDSTNQYIPCSHIPTQDFHDRHRLTPQFLICDRCKHVNEVCLGQETLSRLNQDLKTCGFTMQEKQLEIHGTCGRCATLGCAT
jgi:Fur family zinc uptake transcriptional regulator